MGQLFIGNSTVTQAFCSINEGPRRPLRARSEGPEPPRFTPYFLRATRQRVPEAGVPGFGKNKLMVRFESETPRTCEFDVNVRTTYLLERDIVAFVFEDLLLLMEDTGYPLIEAEPVITPSITPCSQEENQSQR